MEFFLFFVIQRISFCFHWFFSQLHIFYFIDGHPLSLPSLYLFGFNMILIFSLLKLKFQYLMFFLFLLFIVRYLKLHLSMYFFSYISLWFVFAFSFSLKYILKISFLTMPYLELCCFISRYLDFSHSSVFFNSTLIPTSLENLFCKILVFLILWCVCDPVYGLCLKSDKWINI